MIHITRIYADQDGHSHFEDLEMPLTDKGLIGALSAQIPVKHIVFREVAPTYDYDYHTAPDRQYILLLDGRIEIETSLGDRRIFNGGDILLAEDVTGKGHRSRNLVAATRKSVFIVF